MQSPGAQLQSCPIISLSPFKNPTVWSPFSLICPSSLHLVHTPSSDYYIYSSVKTHVSSHPLAHSYREHSLCPPVTCTCKTNLPCFQQPLDYHFLPEASLSTLLLSNFSQHLYLFSIIAPWLYFIVLHDS